MTPTRSANGIWEKMKDKPPEILVSTRISPSTMPGPHTILMGTVYSIEKKENLSTPSSMNATERHWIPCRRISSPLARIPMK